MDFIYPPRGVPLESFHSEISPVAPGRVCDDCYDQLTGTRVPRPPRVLAEIRRLEEFDYTTLPSSLPTTRPTPTRANTSPVVSGSSQHSRSKSKKKAGSESQKQSEPEISYGGLDSYPLKVHSSICKRNGGGRWTPKPINNWAGYRKPFGKAQYEIDMEREEEEERIRQSNPILGNGGEFFLMSFSTSIDDLIISIYSHQDALPPRTSTIAPTASFY